MFLDYPSAHLDAAHGVLLPSAEDLADGFRTDAPTTPTPTVPSRAFPTDVSLVEQIFEAPFAVVHESVHVVAGWLLGLPIQGCQVAADGSGVTGIFHRCDADGWTRFAVATIAPVAWQRTLGVTHPGTQDDLDQAEVTLREIERQTGSRPDIWSQAHRLVQSPAFSAGMDIIVHALRLHGSLDGESIIHLLSDVPTFEG